MSTLGQQATAKGADLGIKLGLLSIFFPMFGWIGDLPSRVRPRNEESLMARFAAWVSALSWSAAALLITAPVWGLVITLFACLIGTRRFAAHFGLGIRVSQLDSTVTSLTRTRPWLLIALPAGVLFAAIPSTHFFGAAILLSFATASGISAGRAHEETSRIWGSWVPALASAFQVSESVFYEQAGLSQPSSDLVIAPVPAAVAVKLVDAAGIDARLGAIDPDWMLSPDSTASRIVLSRVTDEHLEVRDQVLASGGLIVGAPTLVTEEVSAYGPDLGFGAIAPAPAPPTEDSWGI